MLDDLITAYGNRFLVAAVGVSLAILCLFAVLWLLRHKAPSPFVRGGRNRQPRLQVLDAAAVDARRRIVLIRRDNVEHLVMIGGPTDIVIESGIGDERTYISVPEAAATPIPAQPDKPQAIAESEPPARPLAVDTRRPMPQPPVGERRAEAAPVAAAPKAVPTPPPAAAPDPATVTSAPTMAAEPEPPRSRQTPIVDNPFEPEADDDTYSAKVQPVTPTSLTASEEGEQQNTAVEPSASPAQAISVSAPTPPDNPPASRQKPEPPQITDENSVDDILEAARSRVLTPQADPARMPAAMPSPAASMPPAGQPVPQPKAPGKPSSDFERILEDEMNLRLADNMPAAPQRPLAPTVMPPRPTAAPMVMVDPPLRPVASSAGSTAAQPATKTTTPQAANQQEPSLQTEIARIFGEMSVKRSD